MAMTVKDLPDNEYVLSGSAACGGCPSAMALRMVGKALGDNAVMIMTPSCAVASIGLLPNSAYDLPTLNICFASAGASASAVSAAYDRLIEKGAYTGEKPTVFNWVGDGGTYDIGLQGISAAAERGDDIIHFCYNNEAYSNTGVQRSGATPRFASTTTTPDGKRQGKKPLARIMLEHDVPYVATASLAYPLDLYEKVKKAKDIKGFRYIEIHAPCYTGWKFPSSDTVSVARLAVRSGAWLLWEAENGKVKLTGPSAALASGKAQPLSVEEYIGSQGRFAHVMRSEQKEDMLAQLRADFDAELSALKKLAE